MRTKCCNFLHMAIISAGIYIVVPFTIYTFLMLYLILLKLRVETPGSQLFQILLAIISTVSAGLGSFVIKQKLRLKEKANSLVDNTELNSDSGDDETDLVGKGKQEKGGDYNEQIDQTMYTHERREPVTKEPAEQLSGNASVN